MPLQLLLAESAYVLTQTPLDHTGRTLPGDPITELARLPGGAQALLPGLRSLDEAQLETAIQLAEDWLTPHVPGLQGATLDVLDATGRLTRGLQAVLASQARSWDLAALEQAFAQTVHLATGRVAAPVLQAHRAFVADLLLLRELGHHARLGRIRMIVTPGQVHGPPAGCSGKAALSAAKNPGPARPAG